MESRPLFRYIILLLITFYIISIAGESRDLRPSEHGLAYQNSPATSKQNSSAAMTYFFGVASTSTLSPAVRNFTGSPSASTDDWWPLSKKENKGLAALKVAAIVCGGSGIILLFAAGLLFAYHFRKRKSADSKDRNAGSGVIVKSGATR